MQLFPCLAPDTICRGMDLAGGAWTLFQYLSVVSEVSWICRNTVGFCSVHLLVL